MKLHKLISRTVLATALLGVTFGGAFSGINASANPSLSKGNDSSNSSTQMGSNPSAKIIDGSLTLDSVPNFNFGDNGNAAANDQNNLKLQNTSSDNVLKITDYRSKNSNNDDSVSGSKNRWSLNVSATPFSVKNSSDNDDWKINFNKNNLDSTQDQAQTQLQNGTIHTNNKSGSNNLLLTNDGKYGVNQITYNDQDNVSLDVPNVKPDSSSNYTTSMSWNLSAGPRSMDN